MASARIVVGTGQKEDVVSLEPVVAGHGVGQNRGIGVADMRGAVDVVDGGGDVEFRHRSARGGIEKLPGKLLQATETKNYVI